MFPGHDEHILYLRYVSGKAPSPTCDISVIHVQQALVSVLL